MFKAFYYGDWVNHDKDHPDGHKYHFKLVDSEFEVDGQTIGSEGVVVDAWLAIVAEYRKRNLNAEGNLAQHIANHTSSFKNRIVSESKIAMKCSDEVKQLWEAIDWDKVRRYVAFI